MTSRYNRRNFIKHSALATAGLIAAPHMSKANHLSSCAITKDAFGKNFVWGIATAAHQIEGAWNIDGKSPSIWDTFAQQKGAINQGHNATEAVDFYHRYASDVDIVRQLQFDCFRFSTAWSRILPNGTGRVNPKGIDFYNRVIDTCLEKDLIPMLTAYHWDLPQILEDKGGWANRDMILWFEEYIDVLTRNFGDRVKKWLVLNEPMGFTSLGYLTGYHAPGKKKPGKFLAAVHHAALCQAAGGKIIRAQVSDANIGTTFSCSVVDPIDNQPKNLRAAIRLDAALNRLFIEPALGLGYPSDALPALRHIEKYMQPGDEERLAFPFDFHGIQYYFRIVASHSLLPPLFVKQIKPTKRNAELNQMKLEVFPEGIQTMLEKFASYPQIKRLLVSESGVCYEDEPCSTNKICDPKRILYFKESLQAIQAAIHNDVQVDGFMAWTLTDNFEWSEGYVPKFGLVAVDRNTQQRTIKQSGYWFRDFLSE